MATIASPHTSSLITGEEIAEGTMAFHFAKPADFQFRAGQAMDVTLINPPETDGEGNTRAFSIASAPFDADLMIATRMRDTAFKRILREASPGLEVKIEGPSGSLVLHRNAEKAAVFLAGGIGITPFLSIIRQATHDNAPHQIYLFYSNRRPEDTAFLDVLKQAAAQNPRFHLIAAMTEMDKSQREWKGETGFINRDMYCALTRCAFWRWMKSNKRIQDTPDCRSVPSAWPMSSGHGSCVTIRGIRPGPTGTASSSRPATAVPCFTPSCTLPDTIYHSKTQALPLVG